MKFDRILLSARCLSIIKNMSRKACCVETGGPLVGYIANRTLVATNAAGPGPRAKLQRYSVTIDGEHAQKFCDEMVRKSEGRIDYIGDWHKHTGFSLEPSDHDAIAMRTMATFEHSPTQNPISLIFRIWPQAFIVYVWDGTGTLKKMPSNIGRTMVIRENRFG